MLSVSSYAQDIPANTAKAASTFWTLSVMAGEASVARGLPVLVLDRPDWPSYLSGHEASPRAWRSLQGELQATHPDGWRFGALVRAEAWLQASPDAVTAAALEATKSEPDLNRSYSLNARSQSWQGRGIRLGTPWLKLASAERWHWQADVQILQLQQLRTNDLSGNVTYRGADVYDFNVQSQRSNPSMTGPFLPASGRSGVGSSLSIAVQGEPAAGWRLQLRADDLFSRLQWSDLATDTAVLNSQVTSRAADGSLDYAALIQGQQALMRVTRHIGAHWQAKASWSPFDWGDGLEAITFRINRKAGLTQYWAGWDNGATSQGRLHWNLEFEPVHKAASLGLAWNGWQARLSSDGKGAGSELRAFSLGWKTGF